MEEDEFVGAETGNEFVQREPECLEKQTHLADIVEFPCEGLCLLEGESASEEGNAKGIVGGDKLFVGETPGEGLGVEADTKDGAHRAVDESFLKVWARSR